MVDEVKLKVSFDFDSTLDTPSIQEYAKLLIEKGIEVWIVTSRYDSEDKYTPEFLKTINLEGIKKGELTKLHEELFKIADKLGIDKNHIVFTNMIPKYTYFSNHPEFIWHLDDSWQECIWINEFTEVKGFPWMGNKNWKVECSKLLFD